MASLKNLAESAGVSIRTVKRVLTGQGYVSSDVKTAVTEAAEKLGYRPNLAARALKTGRSHEVLVVLCSGDELHMQKMAALEQKLRHAGYSTTILFGYPEGGPEQDGETIAGDLLARQAAGVVIFPGSHRTMRDAVLRLKAANVPCVVLDTRDQDVDSVRIDRQRGVYDAVRYLASRGRKHIAYIGSPDRNRLDGYESAMKELGRAPVVIEAVDSHTGPGGMREAIEKLLLLKPRPDAVQMYSDIFAMRALAELHAKGIKVPEDIAVIGFDDRAMAALAWPRLTTVAQPNSLVGEAAAGMLLDMITGRPRPAEGWTRAIPTQLVVRDSA